MNNKQMKKATVDAINVMISHADKGPSGFWVEDHEGCGNPAVFPEFEEGLKRGRLIQKEHYFCPWNTAIMYGDGHGNIITGCYHSCSIKKARYLSAQELKEILARFKTRMENVKTGNGKLIDYGLRNPTGIQKIEAYELPSDDELIMQEVEQLICETCFLSEQCNRNYCTMDPKKKRLLKQEMFRAIKAQTDKETQK